MSLEDRIPFSLKKAPRQRSGLDTPSPPDAFGEVTAIARGAGIVMLGMISGSGLKYLFEFVVARRLGPSVFGVFFLGLTIFKLLERLCTLELTSGMLRFVSLFRGERNEARAKGTVLSGLRIALLAAAAAGLLLAFLGSWLERVLHAGQLSSVLRIMAIGMIFAAASEILVYSLQALGAVQYRVWLRLILEPGLSILLALAFLRGGWGLSGAALAFLLPLILTAFLAFGLAGKVYPPLRRRDVAAVSDSRQLLSFSVPLFLAGLLSVVLLQINPLLLGYFRPSADVGVFAAAQRTSFFLPLVLESFNAVFAPMIADLAHRREFERLESLFKIVTKWVLALSFPVFLILVSYGDDILSLWGTGYQAGLACLVVVSVGQFVNCATGPVGYMISMSGRSKISLANTAGFLALNIGLNLLLIPRHGIMGSAVAFAVSIALVNIVRLIEVRTLLKFHPYRWDSLKPLAAGLVAWLVLNLAESTLLRSEARFWRLGLGIFLFSVCYVATLALLGIGQEERFVFGRIKEKLLHRRG